ncbi:type VI secretion system tube protein Hcp [uncultured Pseudacidovorax sp.]|jgi:type VI secretion system secreted protein Hcp|uniref:Hcp family type VI secretion system effector n=1 Tax=uncultured Pseudacidovorax sp. TaxID=679313 RepID=UPI0025FB004F|nr:type VI secretion system tube protein Hcp [uncultured Pseudacidovorax sp.]
MAIDMFIKIGDLTGESVDKVHKGKIDVLAWSWGLSQSGTTHMGGGGGSGKVSVQDLSITKYVDASSPSLFKTCCNGTHHKDAQLIVRKAGGKGPVEYIKITMTEVLITAVSTGGSGGEDRLTENVTLNFAKVKVEYTPQKPDGTPEPVKEAEWDIAENAEV